MASPGNPNQPGGGPFDVHKFFNPLAPPPPPSSSSSSNPSSISTTSSQNPSAPSFPPPHSAAYPPPPPSSAASYPPPSGPYAYSPQHYQFPLPPPFAPQSDHLQAANLHHQRSLPYPALPLQPPSPNPNPNHGARLMALLSAPQPNTHDIPSQQPPTQLPMPLPPSLQLNPNHNAMLPSVPLHSTLMRMPSSKLPKGRHLAGDHVLYDVDVRFAGEVQPQLEVTPITKYASDPGLVLGRQIAVNKNYICYGLKMGAIRVLNINTALRSLLKGLAQRVTDMAFFAEDVHLLAGASTDGRVFVWKVTECPDDDDKPQITGKIVVAVHISGEGKSVHPRVCWHCHKQEVLVVGIGNRILRIDTTKVGKGEVYSSEEPLKCPIEKLIDGVQFVGNHDGEVTDLSMCQWMTSRLVSASVDGTIKIWEDRKLQPIAVLRPHDGLPVNSVTFLTFSRPDHIILVTGGPLNREIKIWVSDSEEGFLLPSDSDSWHCTQTLELKSSSEPRSEEVFFNQVLALSQAGLLLLANAKKNAIYAIHLDYGPNPDATRMDYIAEFTVTIPILSFTGTSDSLPHGEQIVQVYCVQTQAIQQYALELSQCLPPSMENVIFERSDSNVSRDAIITEGFPSLEPFGGKSVEISITSSAPRLYDSSSNSAPTLRHPLSSPSADAAATSKEFATLSTEPKSNSSPASNDTDIACVAPLSVPLSPRLSRKLSDFRSPSGSQLSDYGGDQKIIEYSVDRQMDTAHKTSSDVPSMDDDSRNDENKAANDDNTALNRPVKFKHPTHLVTPSEILMAKPSSESNHVTEHKSDGEPEVQDVVVNPDTRNVEVAVKVVGETGVGHNAEHGSQEELHSFPSEHEEKSFCSQASDLGIELARNCSPLPKESYAVNESKQLDGASESKSVVQPSSVQEEVYEAVNDISGHADTIMPTTVQSPVPSKAKKQKGKNTQGSAPSSPPPSAFDSADSSNEPGVSSSIPSAEAAFSQIQAMQEMLIQLTSMQKEMQKQMTLMVTVPVTKEGRRLEATLGRTMEKLLKSNADALWARFQEENAKQEKLIRERTQQMRDLITNCLNKELPATVKKELAAVGPSVLRTVTPAVEKTISTAIVDAFQRGVGDKAVNQLEKSVNSKLEATVARQIQTQFQTSGKQALQDALKSSLEASVVPAFEMSCKAMFDQVDATFQRGMVEHASAAQQQFESMHSPLASALRDTINSASSMTQTLSSELADGQRKLVALAVAGANSKAVNPLVTQLSNGPLSGFHEKIEAPVDPTKELSRLIFERKYEEAFTTALQRSDVWIVSWLCSQVELQGILSMNPLPLSQGVLLSLLQQLACDISKDTPRKLAWMTDVVAAIKPTDQMISVHVRPIFEQVFQILNHQISLPTNSVAEISSMRVVLVIINSMLSSLNM